MPAIFSAAVSHLLPQMRTLSTSGQFTEISPINKAFNLGFLQMICGFLAITVEIASYYTGTGIWSGCLFIVTGILGIVCQKYGYDYNAIVSFMVFSVISSIAALILLAVSCLTVHRFPPFRASPTANVVLLIISVSELVITIKCAATACKIIRSNLTGNNLTATVNSPSHVTAAVSSTEVNETVMPPTAHHININFMWTPNISTFNISPIPYLPPYPCISQEDLACTFFPDAPPVSFNAPPVYEELPPPYSEQSPTKESTTNNT